MPKLFFSLARLQHVKVDLAFHTIDRQAWRYCHSLRIVKLPDTVVAIGHAFQGCYSLVTVEIPGCVGCSPVCGVLCSGTGCTIMDGAFHLAIGAVIGVCQTAVLLARDSSRGIVKV